MKLISTDSSESFEILNCVIEADSSQEIANVSTNTDILEFGEYQIFSGAKRIFTGQLIASLDHKQYKLAVKKENNYTGVLATVLKELECETFVPGGTGKVISVKAEELFSISIKKNHQKSLSVNLNLAWRNWKPEHWDVGSEIFPDLRTVTPSTITKSFPPINSMLKEWLVTASEIVETSRKWYKIKNKYRAIAELKGTLVLHRMVEVLNYETWEIGGPAEENLSLFIDLTRYTCPHTEWKPNTKYKKNVLVLYQDTLKRSKVEHISSSVFHSLYWTDEENYYVCKKESLLYSNFGQDLLSALKNNLQNLILKRYPSVLVEFIGAWDTWKDLELGTTLEIQTRTTQIKAEVTKFTKKMHSSLERGRREVFVQCKAVEGIWQEHQTPFEIIGIDITNGETVRNVSIRDPADRQLEQEKVKGTSIALSINRFYTNHIKVQLR